MNDLDLAKMVFQAPAPDPRGQFGEEGGGTRRLTGGFYGHRSWDAHTNAGMASRSISHSYTVVPLKPNRVPTWSCVSPSSLHRRRNLAVGDRCNTAPCPAGPAEERSGRHHAKMGTQVVNGIYQPGDTKAGSRMCRRASDLAPIALERFARLCQNPPPNVREDRAREPDKRQAARNRTSK